MTNLPSPPQVVSKGHLTRIQYINLHAWVRYHAGHANKCEICHGTGRRYEWSNISGEYKRNLSDWRMLCASCHRRVDNTGKTNICKNGHELTPDNIYTYPNGRFTECRICRKANHKYSNSKRTSNG